jgi:hypothetical protein
MISKKTLKTGWKKLWMMRAYQSGQRGRLSLTIKLVFLFYISRLVSSISYFLYWIFSIGRAHALILSSLRSHLQTVLGTSHPTSRTSFLTALSSGQLLCIAYNACVRKSRQPWGFVSKDGIHDILALEKEASQNGTGDEEGGKKVWTFRRTDNLRLWVGYVLLVLAIIFNIILIHFFISHQCFETTLHASYSYPFASLWQSNFHTAYISFCQNAVVYIPKQNKDGSPRRVSNRVRCESGGEEGRWLGGYVGKCVAQMGG